MGTGTGTRYLVGTSGWSSRQWRGTFYPEKLPQRRWLEYYAEHFPMVELNATFYRLFPDSTYDKWYQQAPEGFEYALKMPRRISHRKHLAEGLETLEAFLGSVRSLGNKAGPLLLQVGPHTQPEPEALERLLERAGAEHSVAVEFRDARAWPDENTLTILRRQKAALVDVDSPLESFHGQVTAPFAYLRLHGSCDWFAEDYSDRKLDAIAEHIRDHLTGRVDRVYVLFNSDIDGSAPRNAADLMARLNSI